MDKLKEIQNKISEIQAKSVVANDLKAFATLFLKVLKESKDDFNTISSENKAFINQTLAYLEQEHEKLKDNVSNETQKVKDELKSTLEEVKKLALEVKNSVPKDGNNGLDGYTPVKGEDYFTDNEIKDIKDNILEQIPEQQTIEEIVKGINELPTNDNSLKIDAEHIKNLPDQVRYYAGNSGIKEVIAGSGISVDNSNLGYPVISASGVISAIQPQLDIKRQLVGSYYDTSVQGVKAIGGNAIWQNTAYENSSYVQIGAGSAEIKIQVAGYYIVKFQATLSYDAGIGNDPCWFEIRKNGTIVDANKFLEQRSTGANDIFTISYESTPILCSASDAITVHMYDGVDDNFVLYDSGNGNSSTTLSIDYFKIPA